MLTLTFPLGLIVVTLVILSCFNLHYEKVKVNMFIFTIRIFDKVKVLMFPFLLSGSFVL